MSPTRDRAKLALVPRQVRSPPYASGEFADFLERRHVTVLDVVRGSSPDTRRLLVGDSVTGSVSYAVAVANHAATTVAIDNEHDVLVGLVERLRPELLATVPHVVERVEMSTKLTGLVLTGVHGLRASGETSTETGTRPLLAAVDLWLDAVWHDTAGRSVQVDLGGEATISMVARYSGSSRLAPVLDSIQRARRRLEQFEVPRTLTHGCLCLRHTKTDGSGVIGVDDWGLASGAAEPLRDLGQFAVIVSDVRLPEVIVGRTSLAGAVRKFVSGGLERTALPRQLWRDVLVLTQLELALEALDRGDPEGINLLIAAVRALPAERSRKEA